MAKAKGRTGRKASRSSKVGAAGRRSTPRRAARKATGSTRKQAGARKKAAKKNVGKNAVGKKTAGKNAGKKAVRNAPRKAPAARATASRAAATPTTPAKRPQLDRARRTLDDIVPTPPSSLNMDRRGSAARSGRAEMADNRRKHGAITPGITGGDVDVDYENAYFSGDEAPGGDNPTPDQDVVDDIGKALGVEYNDNEELKSSDKLNERDKHRWELDPASSEDYKDRD
jgi:membrane protein involved in colicin uptake